MLSNFSRRLGTHSSDARQVRIDGCQVLFEGYRNAMTTVLSGVQKGFSNESVSRPNRKSLVTHALTDAGYGIPALRDYDARIFELAQVHLLETKATIMSIGN